MNAKLRPGNNGKWCIEIYADDFQATSFIEELAGKELVVTRINDRLIIEEKDAEDREPRNLSGVPESYFTDDPF